jgi:type IV secretory pathway VirB2 component (pilin)
MSAPAVAVLMPQPALPTAAQWVVSVVTGTPAVVVATLAIAGIGFLMLAGRFPLRRGGLAIVGCFVLFGASAVAASLQTIASSNENDQAFIVPVEPPSPAPIPTSPVSSQAYDPYAGASVPSK